MLMQGGTEAQLRKDLVAEIGVLQQLYNKIRDYLAGKQVSDSEAVAALRTYKDELSVVSAHILTLYQVKGRPTKITWDSLFTNIDTALENIKNAAQPKTKTAIQTALNMSSPKIEEVMAYLAKLKQSLQ